MENTYQIENKIKKRKILLDLNIHHESILMDLETLSEYVKDYGGGSKTPLFQTF